MSDKKPVRTFWGTEGDKSIDDKGPDALKKDLDVLAKMFDPLATHDDGKQGGISTTNLRDGIFTDAKIGTRTVNDSIADAIADTGTFTQIMSWMAKQIKTVTGGTDWKHIPAKTFLEVSQDAQNAVTASDEANAKSDAAVSTANEANGKADAAVIASTEAVTTSENTVSYVRAFEEYIVGIVGELANVLTFSLFDFGRFIGDSYASYSIDGGEFTDLPEYIIDLNEPGIF